MGVQAFPVRSDVAVLVATLPVGALAAFAGSLSAYLLVLVASGALQPAAIAGARQRLVALLGK